MAELENIEFADNPAAKDTFITVTVNVQATLESWRESIFSFQWMTAEGDIKPLEELAEDEQPKRQAVEQQLKNGQMIEKPILGIGMQDNVEIGSGRAEFLTLAAHGLKTMPVHIPKSNEDDFKDFLA